MSASSKGLLPFGGLGNADSTLDQDPKIRALHKALERNPLDLASALEGAVNGTSLVLAFELGSAVLLFTGDAQWGTWKATLADERWLELLSRTSLLKIGHHGSHNASPRILIDGPLSPQLYAMVSVRPVERWEFIPKVELLQRLVDRGASIARSDRPEEAPEAFRQEDDWWIEVDVPT